MEQFIQDAISNVYTRYGLAVARYISGTDQLYHDEAVLKDGLRNALVQGLNNFRMRTVDRPDLERRLKYLKITFEELQENSGLVAGQLAKKGIYLYPSIITTDRIAKATYDKCLEMLVELKQSENILENRFGYIPKAVQPMANKTNRGNKSQSAPKESLAVFICSAITTVTPFKPSFLANQNVCCIPDMPIRQLCDFIEIFVRMQYSADEDLLTAELDENNNAYKRPKIHNGNFPSAPPFANVLGSAGVLAAIGDWTCRAENVKWAQGLLNNIYDSEGGICFKVFSYNMSEYRSEYYSHFVIKLAEKGTLKKILPKLAYNTIFL